MTPYWTSHDSRHVLYHGDCLAVLPTLAPGSIDAVVTDPPYGLKFMGKKWDYDVPSQALWEAALVACKPGAHLLAFAGTRTQHRMACRIEDAGWEIRDMIAWVYGSGFPKSLNVSKAIDKAAGAEREVVGPNQYAGRRTEGSGPANGDACYGQFGIPGGITAPATPAARQWNGYGTALKPALEPLTMARKPLTGTVAANVLEHGTGALNIDGCRVGAGDEYHAGYHNKETKVQGQVYGWAQSGKYVRCAPAPAGRWPANLIHDGSPEVLAMFPDDGEASAARFFYTAKASKADRDGGMAGMPQQQCTGGGGGIGDYLNDVNSASGKYGSEKAPARNHHPTVKPSDLMAYLVRLVTPPGGLVLDPFAGSGTTGVACIREGARSILIERDAAYLPIIIARMEQELAQPMLIAPEATPETQQDLL